MTKLIAQLIGALWITGGAVTYGLSEVAHVLGRTSQRVYAYDGGYAQILGVVFILMGSGICGYGIFGHKPAAPENNQPSSH